MKNIILRSLLVIGLLFTGYISYSFIRAYKIHKKADSLVFHYKAFNDTITIYESYSDAFSASKHNFEMKLLDVGCQGLTKGYGYNKIYIDKDRVKSDYKIFILELNYIYEINELSRITCSMVDDYRIESVYNDKVTIIQMIEPKKYDIENSHSYDQMVKYHEKINKLIDKFMSEVEKPNGESSCIMERIPNIILRFENQYIFSYYYKFESKFKKSSVYASQSFSQT
jgi:hypothetical protein